MQGSKNPAFIGIHSDPGTVAGFQSRNEDFNLLMFPLRLPDLGALVKLGQDVLFMSKNFLGSQAAFASANQHVDKVVVGDNLPRVGGDFVWGS